MQASGRSRTAPVRYRYRQAEEDEDTQPRATDEGEQSDIETQPVSSLPSISSQSPASNPWFDRVNNNVRSACSAAVSGLKQQSAVATAVAAGLAVAAAALGLVIAAGKRGKQQQQGTRQAGQKHAAGSAARKGKGSKKAAAPTAPGPNSNLKPTRNCVPLSDGSAVVVLRPIAADNSCLFNAVGYSMHHSMNRAPFLRQVVSREVSSDPQQYSGAFLGMENAAYCNWILNPVHWGGGIELAILAAHYRREIAAWNLATGACHVFGEEKGYTKQVMVIYNGVHYDALAISPSPRADQDDDTTEFNPRTKRGKMILAAAQQLVKLHRKGKEGHSEQQQQQNAAKKPSAAAPAAGSSKADSSKPPGDTSSTSQASSRVVANGPQAPAGPDDQSPSNGSRTTAAAAIAAVSGKLSCVDCGVRIQDVTEAQAHAEATGHTSFEEVDKSA